MKYNTQADTRWGLNIMTEGKDKYNKEWKDKLKDFGCLITCYANINQEKSGIEFTPKELNDLLIKHNGYFWLAKDKDNTVDYAGKKIEVKCENASFLYTPVLEGILLFNVTGWLKPENYKKEDNVYWIARIPSAYGGHYINILYQDKYKNFVCFDVLTGYINILPSSKITFLTKVQFKV